ncbi:hypothetical protein [Saccharopolyspora flava]|uniref:hypothetical protein n=1 Tax=Saccharopolyspora flava TaxID=95161 RepID=UPI001587312C|nr:hypothetical protein [Saccharopolyspora flava]
MAAVATAVVAAAVTAAMPAAAVVPVAAVIAAAAAVPAVVITASARMVLLRGGHHLEQLGKVHCTLPGIFMIIRVTLRQPFGPFFRRTSGSCDRFREESASRGE